MELFWLPALESGTLRACEDRCSIWCQLKEHNSKQIPLLREGQALKRVIKPSYDLVTSPLKAISLKSNVTINSAGDKPHPNPHTIQQSP